MRASKDLLVIAITFTCILMVIFGFIGKSIFFHDSKTTSVNTAQHKNDARKYPILTTEAFRLKILKNDPIEIIDLRPTLLYDEEHIPGSKHATIADLAEYAPTLENTEVIIITIADDTTSIKEADAIFHEKNFAYAFLENGMSGWKSQNGNTISIGDPNSVIDRAKVSFKTATDLQAILESAEKDRYAIIDVRSASLYQNGHIPGALNIPIEELEQRRELIPSGRHTIAYGKNDLDSFQAAVRLYDLNIFSPSALENGFTAWTDKKYTIEK